jgi:Ca2+-binding EF-hand superfamily protein
MGEPFLGWHGEDGLSLWFAEADKNHDGYITRDEMVADAQHFFERLDTNHDGEIDPDETTHYEQVIAPEVRSGMLYSPPAAAAAGGQQGGAPGAGHRGGGHRGGGGHFRLSGDSNYAYAAATDEARAGRYGLLQIPEPITSADTDFDRGVSADEFRKAAIERFQLLDVNHTGRLSLQELQQIRDAAIAAAKRAPPSKLSPDEMTPTLDPEGDTEGAIPQ